MIISDMHAYSFNVVAAVVAVTMHNVATALF